MLGFRSLNCVASNTGHTLTSNGITKPTYVVKRFLTSLGEGTSLYNRQGAILRSHGSIFTFSNGCHRCRLQTAFVKQCRWTRKTHSNSQQRGSSIWRRVRNSIFAAGRQNSNKLNPNGKASEVKKSAPSISEVKRLLSLAKPEKWKIAGTCTWWLYIS